MAVETSPNPQPVESKPEPIPWYDRLVLWMFVLAVLLFGALLFGGYVSGAVLVGG